MTLGHAAARNRPDSTASSSLAPELSAAFDACLARSGITPSRFHKDRHAHQALFALVQGLMDVDAWFQRFREAHYHLVKRVIGSEVKSLRGVPPRGSSTPPGAALFPGLARRQRADAAGLAHLAMPCTQLGRLFAVTVPPSVLFSNQPLPSGPVATFSGDNCSCRDQVLLVYTFAAAAALCVCTAAPARAQYAGSAERSGDRREIPHRGRRQHLGAERQHDDRQRRLRHRWRHD